MPANHTYRPLVGAGLLAAVLTSGCETITAPLGPLATPEAVLAPEPQTPEFVPVVRNGRYTLIELVPQPAQRDLMQQVVEVAIPSTLDVNVGDAMRHVLLHSGYRLCDRAEASELYALPLPAAHLRLGPLVLRDALLTLAGSAWDMSVDNAARKVCFKHQTASANSATGPSDTVPNVVQAATDETQDE